jgi:hypothetical protein
MNHADKLEFAQIVNGMAAIKPGGKLTPEGLEVYWLALQGWSLRDFRDVAAHLVRSCEFMPNPYHFEQARKAALPAPGEAFAIALTWVRQGRYRHESCDPQVEAAVRAIGGWQVLAMASDQDVQYLERRFAEHYADLGERTETRSALPALAGPQRVAALLGPRPAP